MRAIIIDDLRRQALDKAIDKMKSLDNRIDILEAKMIDVEDDLDERHKIMDKVVQLRFERHDIQTHYESILKDLIASMGKTGNISGLQKYDQYVDKHVNSNKKHA